jgi:hypothetical protein
MFTEAEESTVIQLKVMMYRQLKAFRTQKIGLTEWGLG